MRLLLGIAGLVALAAATLMSVVNVGGLYAPMTPGIIAMAVILAVGSAGISYAHAHGFTIIAGALAVCMILSESGAGLMTARRVMENREGLRAPLVELKGKRKAASKQLAAVEQETISAPDRSRLAAAEQAKGATEAAVRDKAADKGCRENCRLLLQSAVDAAQREVAAARAEYDELQHKAAQSHEDRLRAAKDALAALPPARSATPLSDETGVPEWAFDIWEALALSIGLNIPGSLLVGLAVNGVPVRAREVSRRTRGLIVAADKSDAMIIEARPIGKVPAFMLERVEPSKSARIEVADLFRGYRDWCQSNGLDALTADAFGDALNAVTENADIEAVQAVAAYISWACASPRRPPMPAALGKP